MLECTNMCESSLYAAGPVVTYIYVNNAITVCIIITGVTQPVPVRILLARVWHKHTVVLETTQQNTHSIN